VLDHSASLSKGHRRSSTPYCARSPSDEDSRCDREPSSYSYSSPICGIWLPLPRRGHITVEPEQTSWNCAPRTFLTLRGNNASDEAGTTMDEGDRLRAQALKLLKTINPSEVSVHASEVRQRALELIARANRLTRSSRSSPLSLPTGRL
jgi:hypothetical protein